MNYFKLKEHSTNVKTETIAGATTFMSMLYIIPVNAAIMSASGMPFDALVTATILMSVIASVLNGLWANTPVAMSVGMGLNAYFSFGLVKGMGIAWQTALGVVFLSGILYLLISLTPLRRQMIEGISLDMKRAVSAGIGAFLAFIGLEEMKIIVDSPDTLVTIGDFSNVHVELGLVGLLLTFFFYIRGIKAAYILGIIATTLIAFVFGFSKLPDSFISLPASIAPIALQLNLSSALSLAMIPVILTFLITDIFDTLGTLTGVGMRAQLFEGKNSVPLQKTIEADAAATLLSGVAGVSSTTAFIESATGVEAGGRTGLTAVVTGLLFLLPLFFLPFFKAIPSEAIYPVLVIVGAKMFSEVAQINYKDPAITTSTFFIVLGMPLTYSITDGLLLGMISFTVIKIFMGEFDKIGVVPIVLSIIGLVLFFGLLKF
ncbi:MAG: guanine permease [Epsilonproteobacteria bacterium (ex Lamellibrachia satsuma)]|nr:MAG: guanine permease [Epsilonproteobacteria bacterium (ex Lamellibrachia satsuma)]